MSPPPNSCCPPEPMSAVWARVAEAREILAPMKDATVYKGRLVGSVRITQAKAFGRNRKRLPETVTG